jgi:hypothetical protein
MTKVKSENFEIRVRSGGTLTLNNVNVVTEGDWMPFIVEENGKAVLIDTTTTSYLDFQASGNANVTLVDSEINGNFDVTDFNADVRLDATDTLFNNDLDDFAGTSEAYLKACYSPNSKFYIEPSNMSVVYVYRRVPVRVVDGSSPIEYSPGDPGQPVEGAYVNLTNTNPEANGELSYYGVTDANGECEFMVMSDRIIAGPTWVYVGGYDVVVEYDLLDNTSTSFGVPSYYNGEGMTKDDTHVDFGTYDIVYIRLDYVLPDLDPPIDVSNPAPGRGETVTISSTLTNI